MLSDVSSSLVRLNIGGKKFCTTVDTLTQREPDSMLAAMFSGRHTVCHDSEKERKWWGVKGKKGGFPPFGMGGEKGGSPFLLGPPMPICPKVGRLGGEKMLVPWCGYVFVDRDGKHFRHVLNWLRDGVVPTLKDAEYSELLREAEYYQLLGLIDGINAVLDKRKDNEELDTELTRTDIIKCIQFEKVKFRGVNLSGLDLSKLDLSFVDFSYACLKNVFFSRANLQCAKFKDVDAEGSIFHNATLRECEFTGANLRGALLAGAYLQSANLQASTADLTNANLEGANLEGANLKGAKLSNANLRGANLQRAYLRHVNLRETFIWKVQSWMVPICLEQSDNTSSDTIMIHCSHCKWVTREEAFAASEASSTSAKKKPILKKPLSALEGRSTSENKDAAKY
ncbi:unnamed protein product [Camellia sinensis]